MADADADHAGRTHTSPPPRVVPAGGASATPGSSVEPSDAGRPNQAPLNHPLDVQFEISAVRGEEGQRLAALQAEVVLDVLTWLHDYNHGERSTATDTP